jgi:superfamily II DNA or RNA helicase
MDVVRQESSVTLTFDRGTLLMRGLGAREMPSALANSLVWDARVGAWRGDALDYALVRRALLEALGLRLRDSVPPAARVSWPKADLPELRPEQREAVQAWQMAGRRGVIVMPTGTGKTEVALAAIAAARVSTLVVAPVRDLMYQWHQRILRRLGYDAGIVGDSVLNVQPVTVTTYDSAYARMPEMGRRFELIIFDEVHHLPGRSYREAALFSTAAMRLGLTATPERADGRHVDLDRLIGPIVYRQEIAHARGRTLADYDVVRIPVRLSDAEQAAYDQASQTVRRFLIERNQALKSDPATAQQTYSWQDLCADAGSDPAARRGQKAFYFKRSIEDRAAEKLRVLEDLFRLHAGERVLVFAASNAMALDVSRRFLAPTLLSHSRKVERRAVLEGFASGAFPVLVANQVLDEGVDVPAAKVAVVIGGQASTRQAKQRLGRILRPSGAARAVLYEIVCQDTNEEERSRKRRRSDAYDSVKRRKAIEC